MAVPKVLTPAGGHNAIATINLSCTSFEDAKCRKSEQLEDNELDGEKMMEDNISISHNFSHNSNISVPVDDAEFRERIENYPQPERVRFDTVINSLCRGSNCSDKINHRVKIIQPQQNPDQCESNFSFPLSSIQGNHAGVLAVDLRDRKVFTKEDSSNNSDITKVSSDPDCFTSWTSGNVPNAGENGVVWDNTICHSDDAAKTGDSDAIDNVNIAKNDLNSGTQTCDDHECNADGDSDTINSGQDSNHFVDECGYSDNSRVSFPESNDSGGRCDRNETSIDSSDVIPVKFSPGKNMDQDRVFFKTEGPKENEGKMSLVDANLGDSTSDRIETELDTVSKEGSVTTDTEISVSLEEYVCGDSIDYVRVGSNYQCEIPEFQGYYPVLNFPEAEGEEYGKAELSDGYPYFVEWSLSERQLFEKAIHEYGADFSMISKYINKTMARCMKKVARKNTLSHRNKSKVKHETETSDLTNSTANRDIVAGLEDLQSTNSATCKESCALNSVLKCEKKEAVKDSMEANAKGTMHTVKSCIQYFYDHFRFTRMYETWRKQNKLRREKMQRLKVDKWRLAEKLENSKRREPLRRAKNVNLGSRDAAHIRNPTQKSLKESSNKQKPCLKLNRDVRKRRTKRNEIAPRKKRGHGQSSNKSAVSSSEQEAWSLYPLSCKDMERKSTKNISVDPLLRVSDVNKGKRNEVEFSSRKKTISTRKSSSKSRCDCVCRGVEEGLMICCSKCKAKFHMACVGLREDMLSKSSYFSCANCTPIRSEIGFSSPELFFPSPWKIDVQQGESPYLLIIALDDMTISGQVKKPLRGIGCDGFILKDRSEERR